MPVELSKSNSLANSLAKLSRWAQISIRDLVTYTAPAC